MRAHHLRRHRIAAPVDHHRVRHWPDLGNDARAADRPGPKRIAEPEAGFQRGGRTLLTWTDDEAVLTQAFGSLAEAAARRAMEHGMRKVDVFVKGPGPGRETAIRSLTAAGLEVGAIADVTPQPHNGVRPPKPRRN